MIADVLTAVASILLRTLGKSSTESESVAGTSRSRAKPAPSNILFFGVFASVMVLWVAWMFYVALMVILHFGQSTKKVRNPNPKSPKQSAHSQQPRESFATLTENHSETVELTNSPKRPRRLQSNARAEYINRPV